MNKLGVFTTYECESMEQLMLAKVVVPHEGYQLKEEAEWILGPTSNQTHFTHCYLYDLKGNFRGCMRWSWFEITSVFSSHDELQAYLQTRCPERDNVAMQETKKESKKKRKGSAAETYEEEQLSLF